MNLVTLAVHIPTGKIIHIDRVPRGKACECKCFECGCEFEAIQGETNQHHFRHRLQSDCKGSQETALHKLAKQIIVENSKIEIPEHGAVYYTNAVIEKIVDSFRTDVTVKWEGRDLHFEMLVTHAISEEKESHFIKNEYKCIEIDLRGIGILDYDELEDLILKQTSNKKIIFWEKKRDGIFLSRPFSPKNSFIKRFIIVLGLSLFVYWLYTIIKRLNYADF